ncbi:GNAT family N-acetyltransferase [Aliagarivorans marinus]|uniref:GNAT family N-acetyltransferase n=1 Tax=Aliagarivorans marinus TaxID=561965 RepID=UPI00040CEF5C|nr:GNAT family protein [Aliagarivorans marinus]
MHSNNIDTPSSSLPIGEPLPNWSSASVPSGQTLNGRYVRLEAIDLERHANSLYAAYIQDTNATTFTYLSYTPWADFPQFQHWLETLSRSQDPLFYVLVDQQTDNALGLASYLRIDPEQGAIEVGHLHFSPALQRSRLSTEAMYLMMRHAFDELGYRRYEWKCDSLNQASRNASERLGFIYEGTFRQARVYKQRNRDTAWFSIIDKEWPARKSELEQWLAPDNFDQHGQQQRSLKTIRNG